MKVEGYMGICGCCFEPIPQGEEVKINSREKYFHKDCVKNNPNSYYVQLETFRGIFENNTMVPGELMTEIERFYKIPMINNEDFNKDNEEVMKLYLEISDSRIF